MKLRVLRQIILVYLDDLIEFLEVVCEGASCLMRQISLTYTRNPQDFGVCPSSSDGKASDEGAGDPGSVPGWRRSPGEGNGNTLQYSCLENTMDRGTSRFTVHGGCKKSYRTEWLRLSLSQTTSPGWMHETGAQGWCTGKTQRDGMGREAGGGIGMGNAGRSMADSCQCMAKPTTIL